MAHNTKREQSAKQKINIIIKKDYTLTDSSIPSVKNLNNMRSRQLALNFLAQKGDPTSKNITLKEFAKQNKIGENTIRNQIKFLTGETLVKHNKKSNNIEQYNKKQKQIKSKHKANTSQSDYKASLKGTSAQHAAGGIKDEDWQTAPQAEEEFENFFDKAMNSLTRSTSLTSASHAHERNSLSNK
jgi:Fe2+ or Zn2+ uptake regulation protein